MKALKKAISSVLVSSLLIPHNLMANDYLNQQKESVAAKREAAIQAGEYMASKDFQDYLYSITDGFAGYTEEQAKFIKRLEVGKRFEKSLVNIIELARKGNDLTTADIDKIINAYQQYSTERFRFAWSKDDLEFQLEESQQMLEQTFQRAKYRCKVGVSDANQSFVVPAIPEPPYFSSFGAKFVPNFGTLINLSFPFQIKMYYGSGTAGSEAANRDRARLAGIAVYTSNTANAAWVTSTLAPGLGPSVGLSGQFFSSMVAAAPVTLVVAAVVMAIVDVLANREANRIADQIYAANLWSLENNPTYADAVDSYKQNCKDKVEILASLRNSLHQVILEMKNGKVTVPTEEDVEAVFTFEEDSENEAYAQKQILMEKMREQQGCISVKGMSTEEATKVFKKNYALPQKKQKNCYLNREGSVFVSNNGIIALPADQVERNQVILQAEKTIDAYSKEYTNDRIAFLMGVKVRQVLANYTQLQDEFENIDLENLAKLQREAFAKLLKVIALRKMLNPTKADLAFAAGINKLTEAQEIGRELDDLLIATLISIYNGEKDMERVRNAFLNFQDRHFDTFNSNQGNDYFNQLLGVALSLGDELGVYQ